MVARWKDALEKIDDWRWRLPEKVKPGMRVPGMVFATEEMLGVIGQDQALEQVANVAFLPGIVKYSMAMPDIHWGYGFPIGGVAAMRVEDGVISPGGVGFDINCGTRVLRTSLTEEELRPHVKTHKCVEAARLQVRGHFGGITVSTLAEANFFATAGVRDMP
jgi:tRNA-splicing ligase RtcB